MKDPVLLKNLEGLIDQMITLTEAAQEEGDETKIAQLTCGMKALTALADAALKDRPVFGLEPWHPIDDNAPLKRPGEMLLRLETARGEPLPPYPAIMAFYENGLTAEIDTVLFLYALRQYEKGGLRQVSINISARSLRSSRFVQTILSRLKSFNFAPDERIIAEIHESRPHMKMNIKVLKLLQGAGLGFAIDDVGLSMNDIMRLSDFEGIADFIKIDRHSVNADPEKPHSLDNVVSIIHSILPRAALVAEGVKSADQARRLREYHPAIGYVQGLHLPPRDEFARKWQSLSA